MRLSPHQACVTLGLSGSTQKEYRTRGVTEKVADRLAVKAGLNPYEVWPQMADDLIASLEVECIRPDCTVRFVPTNPNHKACSERCRSRETQRRHRAQPHGAEAARASAATYYAENRSYVQGRSRRHYEANRDRILARRRELYRQRRQQATEAAPDVREAC